MNSLKTIRRHKYLNLISYFGGKYPHLNWLLPIFPAGDYHFIDIMCGSASVSLNVNYPLVTINDINSDVVNLFEVLREDYDEFMRRIYFTPFSREIHKNCVDTFDTPAGKTDRAVKYFIRTQLSFGGNGSQQNHHGVGFEYKVSKSKYYKVDNWNNKLEKLPIIVEKLRHIQIENRDCFELFERVNTPGNIVYFDPPYVKTARSSRNNRYHHEVKEDFHSILAQKVRNASCFVVISGYESDLYNDIFKDFLKITGPAHRSNTSKSTKQEVVWTNYEPLIY